MALIVRRAGRRPAFLLLGLAAAAPAATPPEPAFLRHQWEHQAAAGDARAAYQLGLMYDLGQGVAPNAAVALDWYRRAGSAGMAEGAFNAAVMLDDGQSVGRDRAQAAMWYARAALHGNARAALNLSRLYQAGDGVPHNEAAALAWLDLAVGHVPIARQRARALRAKLADMAPAAPDTLPPAAKLLASAGTRPAELVWTAPDAPSLPLRYVVSVAVPGKAAWTPVQEQATSLTATLAPETGCYAWRVYSMLPGGVRYGASGWQVVGCKV